MTTPQTLAAIAAALYLVLGLGLVVRYSRRKWLREDPLSFVMGVSFFAVLAGGFGLYALGIG